MNKFSVIHRADAAYFSPRIGAQLGSFKASITPAAARSPASGLTLVLPQRRRRGVGAGAGVNIGAEGHGQSKTDSDPIILEPLTPVP